MRASSLSNARIIDLLNHFYVPVYLRNEDCAEDGSAPIEERNERNRIYHQALSAGLAAGTVCAYLLAPDGRPMAVAPLNESTATDPERLFELMKGVIDMLKASHGEPIVPPKPQSGPPASDADSLVLHITARYLERAGDEFLPVNASDVLGTRRAGNWGNLPSEDWVVLTKADWTKLLPTGDFRPESRWPLDRDVTSRFLQHFFPPTENTDVTTNRIEELSLTARTESVEDTVATVKLECRLKMKHPFYRKDDGNYVEATLVGYMEIDTSQPQIRSIRIVTDRGVYGGSAGSMLPFGAALRVRR
jgi:hypothetical protein